MPNTDQVKLSMQLSNGVILQDFETASLGGHFQIFEINEFGQIVREGSKDPIPFSGTINLVSCNSDHEYDIFFHNGVAGSILDTKSRQVVGYPKKQLPS